MARGFQSILSTSLFFSLFFLVSLASANDDYDKKMDYSMNSYVNNQNNVCINAPCDPCMDTEERVDNCLCRIQSWYVAKCCNGAENWNRHFDRCCQNQCCDQQCNREARWACHYNNYCENRYCYRVCNNEGNWRCHYHNGCHYQCNNQGCDNEWRWRRHCSNNSCGSTNCCAVVETDDYVNYARQPADGYYFHTNGDENYYYTPSYQHGHGGQTSYYYNVR